MKDSKNIPKTIYKQFKNNPKTTQKQSKNSQQKSNDLVDALFK